MVVVVATRSVSVGIGLRAPRIDEVVETHPAIDTDA
jgi:hypothetical protein